MSTLLHLAMLCALCGAFAGDRTAWVLLGNVGVCLMLDRVDFGFEPELWIQIDILAAMAIFRPSMVHDPRAWLRDWTVIALFFLAIPFYYMADPWRYYGSAGISTVQMLLAFPAALAINAAGNFIERLKASASPFDEFVRALFPVRLRGAV